MLCRKSDFMLIFVFFYNKIPNNSINNIYVFSVLNNKCNKANKKEDRENILCEKVPLKVLSYYHASGFNFVHLLEFLVIIFHYLHICWIV